MPKPFQRDLSLAVNPRDHRRGKLNAKVRIVIYADFADPDLLPTQNTLDEILSKSADDVLVVYRHFPDTANHPEAYASAQALEAAAKQGKFHEMLVQILANQDELSDGFLRQYAHAIDLDVSQFEDDFSSQDVAKRIKHDIKTGKDSKVDTTPAIFINGVRQSTLSGRFIHELIESGGNVSG